MYHLPCNRRNIASVINILMPAKACMPCLASVEEEIAASFLVLCGSKSEGPTPDLLDSSGSHPYCTFHSCRCISSTDCQAAKKNGSSFKCCSGSGASFFPEQFGGRVSRALNI